jgi:hypothetical protein
MNESGSAVDEVVSGGREVDRMNRNFLQEKIKLNLVRLN